MQKLRSCRGTSSMYEKCDKELTLTTTHGEGKAAAFNTIGCKFSSDRTGISLHLEVAN